MPLYISDIFGLTFIFKFLNGSFQIFLLAVPEMSSNLNVIHCLDFLHYFDLEPVTTAFLPGSFDLKIVNILLQTMVYAASIYTDLDSLWLRLLYTL